VARIGTKSLVMEYALEDSDTKQVLATGETIMVAFDYPTNQSILVPDDWRDKIHQFEGTG
jgi:acyl-CoA thioester hydrolase